QDFVGKVGGAVRTGRCPWMFGIALGGQYPTDLGQGSILDVLSQIFQRPMPHAVFINGRTWLGLAKTLKGQTTMHSPCPVIIGILINAPADPFLLQHIRDSWPFKSSPLVSIAGFRHLSFDPATEVDGFGILIRAVDTQFTVIWIIHRSGPKDNPVGIRSGGNGT